jgi:hypothetical protein
MAGQNIQANTPMAIGQPGTPVRANGGGGAQVLQWRSGLDARRTMQGSRSPQAEYPDGYLGTIVNRRQDKLMNTIQGRLTQRMYQRGVHKGDKIDQRDYFWPDEFTPQTGLEYEARGLNWTARGAIEERLAHGGKTEMASPAEVAALANRYAIDPQMKSSTIDPVRQERMQRLLPGYR